MSTLTFSGTMGPDFEKKIQEHPDAASVRFEWIPLITVGQVRLLQKMDRLKSLAFSACDITDSHLQEIPTSLHSLTLNNCPNIKDFTPLSNMTSLREVSIIGSTKIKDLSPIPQTVETIWVTQNIPTDDKRVKSIDFPAGNWETLAQQVMEIK